MRPAGARQSSVTLHGIYDRAARARSTILVPDMYAFSKQLRFLEQTRRYSIVATENGWEVREERDSKVIRQAHYQDWHRVERARRSFTVKLRELKADGWAEVNG